MVFVSSSMKVSSSSLLIGLLILVSVLVQISAETVTCPNRKSPCFLKKITCPAQCPSRSPKDPHAKVCFFNCNSPICKAWNCLVHVDRKPNCNSPGAACLDPRFIGGDGIVFYFHGKSNEHYTLVSDLNLQINSRFTGLRPEGRTRDYTWIQALGFLFDSQTFSLEAEGHLSSWQSPESNVRFERTSNKNSVMVTLPEVAEISVNVVPVTKEDDRIHNYKIPSDDCFAHLEVQFRFYGLSSKVEGVLGRTYQPDFKNPAKPGVAMPVVGGEDKYRTTSLLSANCTSCIFSPAGVLDQKDALMMDYGMLDCTGGSTSGNGIVCRK